MFIVPVLIKLRTGVRHTHFVESETNDIVGARQLVIEKYIKESRDKNIVKVCMAVGRFKPTYTPPGGTSYA